MSNEDYSISPEEFVNEFKELKDNLLEAYFSKASDISRISTLQENGFSSEQITICKKVMADALTDSLYTVLLGLEGSASISRHQIMYKLFDEANNELTGELESIAWEKFHGEIA